MATDNNNKVLNVPTLRFPEFRDKWKEYRISDLLDFFSTNSLSWDQLDYDKGEILNLHYGLIHKGLPTMVNMGKDRLPYIKSSNMPRSFTTCQDGDVAFADASEDTNDVAKVIEFKSCNNENIVCGLHTIHGRDKENTTVVGYKGYAFSSAAFHKQIRRIAQGTKIYSINIHSFDETYIGVPSKEEQTKISNLLSLLDERISTQNKIIEDLKKLKSAITTGLLVRRIRLRCFTSKWTKTNLGSITTCFSKRNKENIVYPMYSVTNEFGFIPQSVQFGDREMVGEDISAYKIINNGDIAYNPARINVGSIGRYMGTETCMISSLYVCIRTTKDIDSDWLMYLLKSDKYIYKYGIYGEGGVRIYLFYPNFSRIEVFVPPLDEQKGIATTITSISKKIEVETTLMKDYIKQKKYLLHQMFI